MEREMNDRTERILGQTLRRQLQGRVPPDILATLSDADLVRKHREHHKMKLAVLADASKKSRSTVRIVR